MSESFGEAQLEGPLILEKCASFNLELCHNPVGQCDSLIGGDGWGVKDVSMTVVQLY